LCKTFERFIYYTADEEKRKLENIILICKLDENLYYLLLLKGLAPENTVHYSKSAEKNGLFFEFRII